MFIEENKNDVNFDLKLLKFGSIVMSYYHILYLFVVSQQTLHAKT